MQLSSGLVITFIPDFSDVSGEVKERWEKWIAALRSKNYTQTKRALHNQGGFCCLGVASDVVIDEVNGSWADSGQEGQEFRFIATTPEPVVVYSYLCPSVQELFQLDYKQGFVVKIDKKTANGSLQSLEISPSLADLNDSGQATFEDIANILETALRGGLNPNS